MNERNNNYTGLEIAVIGMAGRFPGAQNIKEFWENLANGVETVTFFPDEELEEAGVDKSLLENPNYVKAMGYLKGIEDFDADFFDYTPGEAEVMDPQIRLFHECAWEALEDAGYVPDTYDGLIGLWAGASDSFHWKGLAVLSGQMEKFGQFGLDHFANKDYLCSRIAYKLNLRGPVVSVHTACSTSLVAIHMACQGLLSGETDVALAGGVSIIPFKGGYLYQEGMIQSPDGHCRAFDGSAAGTLAGCGLAIVALKRLEDAVEDGDYIHAVIKGSSVNNDGVQKIGYTAPSVEGQVEVLQDALQTAQVEVESIGYIEAHGTGTALGDPVEIEALIAAYETDKKGFCGIGSVKSNFGHLDTAAGIAGFIKAVLALKHRLIPPTLNFEVPNNKINLIDSPFYINADSLEWERDDYPLRAGVTSLGIGGTNVHVILEEWPEVRRSDGQRVEDQKASRPQLILVSARTPAALDKAKENLGNYLKENPCNLEDAAYTLQKGRKAFKHRWMAVCSTAAETIEALTSPEGGEIHVVSDEEETAALVASDRDSADIGRQSLTQIGQAWLRGQKIDWNELYKEKKRHRIPLPTYPFERKRYWLETQGLNLEANVFDQGFLSPKKRDIIDWFYIPSWKRSALPVVDVDADTACWLVFVDGCRLGSQLVEKLEEKKQAAITVTMGREFLKQENRRFIVNPQIEGDYDALFAELQRRNLVPNRIVHLWGVTANEDEKRALLSENIDDIQNTGFYSLLNIARAIGKQGFTDKIEITVVTNNMQEVTGGDSGCPGKATVMGPVKVIPVEYPNIACRSIDVELPLPWQGSKQAGTPIHRLFDELMAESIEPVVAYRGNHRWVQIFEPIRLEKSKDKALSFKQEGVYLITGGLGGIGFRLAEYLAKTVQAKLILTGRTGLPPRGEWDRRLAAPNDNDGKNERIKKVKTIEELGSEVLVLSADVTHRQQMQNVINQAVAQFGRIDGVIHAAGLPDGAMIQRRTREASERIFAAKIKGTLVLDALLRDMELDFFILCSSINSILPIFGQVGYCGANAFMDAFAHYKASQDSACPTVISINWTRWQSIGIATIAEEYHKNLTGEDLTGGLSTGEGVETFSRIPGNRLTQVIVSRENLQQLVEQYQVFKVSSLMETLDEAAVPGKVYQRPELKTEYVPPVSDIEKQLAGIWARFFGFDRVGIQDDFFELGGDSLKVITLVSRIHKELNVRISIEEFFKRPTIRGLTKYIETKDAAGDSEDRYISIEPFEKKEYYSLSSAQKRLYLLQQMDLNTTVYNIPFVSSVGEDIDKSKLESALKELIARHDSLRTSFIMVGDEPVQRVHEPDEVEFEIEQHTPALTGHPSQEGISLVYRNPLPGVMGAPPGMAEGRGGLEHFVRAFDLSKAPLIRSGIIETPEGNHTWMIDVHHIAADGVSQVILIEDFISIYNDGELVPLKLQYKDFAAWQNRLIKSGGIDRQEAYWLNLYRDSQEIPRLNIPSHHKRPEVFTFAGDSYGFSIEKEETIKFRETAAKNGGTLYMCILASLNVLFYKYSGQTDIIIGSITAGRQHDDIQGIIGMFANTLAMRNYPEREKKYELFLKEVIDNSLRAFENQDVQFEEVVDKLDLERDPSRNPLFDICMVFQNLPQMAKAGNTPAFSRENEKEKFSFSLYKNPISRFDMTFFIYEINETVYIDIEYYTGIFKEETIRRLVRHFKNVVQTTIDEPNIKLKDIEIVTEEEKRQVLFEFNDTDADYPADKTIHELFEEEAARTPDGVALVGSWQLAVGKKERNRETVQLTYRELNQSTNRLAHLLREKGIKSDAVVGIMVDRSAEMIIGIFGILKGGGAYLPIDPDYPQERVNYMLKDSNAQVLLSEVSELSKVSEGTEVVTLSELNEDFPTHPTHLTHHTHLCYVIYTSGSTGRPKGVMVEHRSLVNRLKWMQKKYPIGEGDTILHKTTFTFDVSAWEIFWWAIRGARVCLLAPGGEKDPRQIIDGISRNRVTVVHFVPSMLSVFLDYIKQSVDMYSTLLRSLRQVIASGEALSAAHVHAFRRLLYSENGTALANLYGPTEATIDVSYFDCLLEEDIKRVPIGKPIDNIRLYIMGPGVQLQPVGVGGELCIAGVGLARGYLNRPELTAEKFVLAHSSWLIADRREKKASNSGELPMSYELSAMSYLYKTGDLALWLPDGNIEFLGRIDHQVKIRGFRIELGEIENLLLNKEEIKEAVVLAREDKPGDKYLCAYISAGKELDHSGLRDSLVGILPDYMVPSYFIQLERIPLTANGKIDRRALPAPEVTTGEEYTTPRTWLEAKLAGIWSDVLAVNDHVAIGIDNKFFELGGHSLKAAILTTRIHKELGVKVPLVKVFKHQTIRSLAEYIRQLEGTRYASIEPVEEREYHTLSSAQKRLYFLQQMDVNSTAYNMPLVLPLGKGIEIDRLENTLKKLIDRHESLRTSFIKANNEPVQRVHEPEEVEFEIEQHTPALTGHPSQEGISSAYRNPLPGGVAEGRGGLEHFVRAFDLSKAPLIRSGIIKTPDGNHIWMVDIHHIVSDGTSQTILAEDFMALYNGKALEPLSLQYKDFSCWQNRLFEGGEIKSQEDYWLGLYSGEIPKLDLPADYKRPEIFTFTGDNYQFVLEKEEAAKFKSLASGSGGTLYMNILTALNTLFHKYTSQTDIIIGTGIAGRPHADLQQIIGMFINTLAMRNTPESEKTYLTFLKEVIDTSVTAFENQDVQFEELVDKLDLERDASRNPLFDIMMVVQNFRKAGEAISGVDDFSQFDVLPTTDENLPAAEYKNVTAKFDMTFFVHELGDDVYINIEYYTGIFDRKSIQRLVSHFKNVINAVINQPDVKLKEIDIIPGEEKKQLLDEFNNTAAEYPEDKTIHEIFEEQAERTPDHGALVYEGDVLTYRGLDQQANQLACYLHYERGIHSANDNRVGIFMSHSWYLPIAILGVLKAGGAFVPLEPSLPEERIKYMINDAFTGIVISEKRYIRTLNRLQWECKDFHSYLCMDSFDIHGEDEVETNELMNEELWNHVGETAVNEITGGGWVSSYTGEPFSKEEMDEYGENILKKLEPLLHEKMRVLEIGCASGISMYRIAPKVGLYYGTDLSAVIIDKNKKRVQQEGYSNIKLSCLAAHDIDTLEENNFDLIIMNSVIQCFHGHNYLRKVIRKCIDLVGEKGYLFIGDIMDQEKADALVRELLDFKYANRGKNYTTKTDFSAELFVSRGFWEDLEADLEVIEKIDFSDKIYTIENELSKFRYDALVIINKDRSLVKSKHRKKQKYQDDLRALSKFDRERLDPGIRIHIQPNNLAYVIYTSGSTGKPKGVMIEHRGISSLSVFHKTNFRINEMDRLVQFASSSFDASVWEIFMALLSGAALYVVSREVIGNFKLFETYFNKNRITMVVLPPPYANHLDPDAFGSLRLLITGGSASTPGLVDKWREKVEYINAYGPTETTICATCWHAKEGIESVNVVPIGKPLNNTYIYILDGNLNVRPIGIPGELCIAGIGVARGYLNRPELTAEKFDHDLWDFQDYQDEKRKGRGSKNSVFSVSSVVKNKIYKTGDLARWLPDGNIEFLGRMDQQVKLRGFRIELGEIESRLLKHDLISEAFVIDRDSGGGDKYLCAYIVLREMFDLSELKDYLSSSLPDYMIPSYFVDIDKIPLTPSGKVDSKALPEPEVTAGGGYTAPRNEVEKKLVGIWQEILGVNISIGINDNFFELGGHSLKATVITSRIYKEFGIKIPLVEIFRFPTIRGLSGYMEASSREEFMEIEPVAEKEYYELSFNQKRLWIIQQMNKDDNAYNMPDMIEISQDENGGVGVDVELIKKTIHEIIARHESLRTGFKEIDGKPVQYVVNNYALPFDVEDVSFMEEREREIKLKKMLDEFNLKPFLLDEPPLFRTLLIKSKKDQYILAYNIHHIVSDGWSMGILERDFHEIFHAYLNGSRGIELKRAPSRITYKDFTGWHNRQIEDGYNRSTSREFWVRFLKEELPILRLPGDFDRIEGDKRGASFRFALPGDIKDALNQLSKAYNITLFALMYSIYNIFLGNISGQRMIVSSVVNAGRDHPSLQDIVGFFVNSVIFKTEIKPEEIFIDFAKSLQERVLEFFGHQTYPLELVLDEVGIQYPEVASSFNMINIYGNRETASLENLESFHTPEIQNVKFDIEPYVQEFSNGIEINVSYNRDRFKAENIEYMMAKYRKIIEYFAFNPQKQLKDFKEERKRRSFKRKA